MNENINLKNKNGMHSVAAQSIIIVTNSLFRIFIFNYNSKYIWFRLIKSGLLFIKKIHTYILPVLSICLNGFNNNIQILILHNDILIYYV
jgi:hypothetical protein